MNSSRKGKRDRAVSSSSSDIVMPSLLKHTESSKQKSKKVQSNKPDALKETKAKQKPAKVPKEPQQAPQQSRSPELADLKKKLKSYSKQLSQIRTKLKEDSMTQSNTNSKTIDEYQRLVNSLQLTVEQFKVNELQLLEELQRQQEISKEALSKLYQYQQENIKERDRLRDHYQEYFLNKAEEEKQAFLDEIKRLESEVHYLKNRQSQQSLKTAHSLDQRDSFQIKERLYQQEISTLKNTVGQMEGSMKAAHEQLLARDRQHQAEVGQLKDQLYSMRETAQFNNDGDENAFLKRQVQDLKEKEIQFNYQISIMEQKLQKWQDGVGQAQHLERRNEEQMQRIDHLERKLNQKRTKLKKLKQYQSSQYHDLSKELKLMKFEMDRVMTENKLVISKLTPKKLTY